MVYYILALGTILSPKSNSFKRMVSIGTYCIGLTLNAFAIGVMENIEYRFGVLYWLCAGVLAVFMFSVGYGRIWVRRMVKEAIIQNLLHLEK